MLQVEPIPVGTVPGVNASQPDRNPNVPVSVPMADPLVPSLERNWGTVPPGRGLGSPAAQAQLEGVATMIHPPGPEIRPSIRVRDGRDGPVTCAACGCRLSATGAAFFHFNPIGGRDARGCRVDCSDAAHDALGRAIAIAV